MTDCWSFEISILNLGLEGEIDYYFGKIKDGYQIARLRGSLKVLLDTMKDVTDCINRCDSGDRCNSVGNTHDKKKWFYVFGFSIIFNNFVFRVLK